MAARMRSIISVRERARDDVGIAPSAALYSQDSILVNVALDFAARQCPMKQAVLVYVAVK